jgi:plastocyanin
MGCARHRWLIALAGAALAAAPASAMRAGRHYTITIQQLAYGPQPASVRVGDTINWVNADVLRHTATAKDKSFDLDLAPKARARVTLHKAGVVQFYCRYHPGMIGHFTIVP